MVGARAEEAVVTEEVAATQGQAGPDPDQTRPTRVTATPRLATLGPGGALGTIQDPHPRAVTIITSGEQIVGTVWLLSLAPGRTRSSPDQKKKRSEKLTSSTMRILT